MAKDIRGDVYDQFLHFSVVQSAANTLTFGHISMGMSMFDYAAILISRIEYHFPIATLNLVINVGDILTAAITGTDTITTLDLDQPQVYDKMSLYGMASGTPANFIQERLPVVADYSSMRGGGLMVPAGDVYIGLESASLSAAGTCNCRLYYTVKALKAEQYIELAQRLRVLST